MVFQAMAFNNLQQLAVASPSCRHLFQVQAFFWAELALIIASSVLLAVVSRAPFSCWRRCDAPSSYHPFYRTAHAFAVTSRASVPSAHTLSELRLTAVPSQSEAINTSAGKRWRFVESTRCAPGRTRPRTVSMCTE